MNNEVASGVSQDQPAEPLGEFGFSERDFEDTTASLQRHRSKNSLPTPNSSLPTSCKDIVAFEAHQYQLNSRMKKISSGPQILPQEKGLRAQSSEKKTL